MNRKVLIFGIVCATLTAIMAGLTMFMVATRKPVVNNYKIDYVDKLVLPEDAIESDRPIKNEVDKTVYSENLPMADKYKVYEETFYKTAYEVGEEFKPITCKINNWVVKEEYQRVLYNACKKYNINYIQALAIMYQEQAFNDPYATSKENYNGTRDMGLMQINSFNTDVVKKVAKTEDMTMLYNPIVNINCGCYIIWRNEKYNEYCQNSMFDSIMAYNGGQGTLQRFKNGELTEKCDAYQYAKKVVGIMEQLDSWYREECV